MTKTRNPSNGKTNLVLTDKNNCKENAHSDIGVKPKYKISNFGVNKAGRQIIDHSDTPSFACPYHNDDHEEKENFRFPLKD